MSNVQLPRRPRRRRYWPWFLIACAVCASALLAGTLGTYQWQYQDRIYPGVSVAGQVAGDLTRAQLAALLVARRDVVLQHGLWLDVGGELVNLPLEVTSSDPDLARVPVSYDINSAVVAAYRIGRGGTLWSQLIDPLRLRWLGWDVAVPYTIDAPVLEEILSSVLAERETPPLPARLSVNGSGALELLAERNGVLFDHAEAFASVKRRLASMDTSPIPLRMSTVLPPIASVETVDAFQRAQNLLHTSTPTFVYEEHHWSVDRPTFLTWLEFQRVEEAGSRSRGPVRLGFNTDAVTAFLVPIAKEIDVPPQDAKWRLENDRVVEFQVSRDGISIDLPGTMRRLQEAYLTGVSSEIPIAVQVAPAKIGTADANGMGISELLGVGRSNAAGSPKNRWHNIRIGVNTLNGILIAPDEEFSLLKALGSVDGEHGYLQELVIKGDRTVPEFGGGLCQIGTTVFRAALHSGLPITQRQNHSFRIRYYNPPGMDATIYDPAPDFRFRNDTGRYILFLAEVADTELVFSFYGASDGRKIEVPDRAIILNSIASGPIRYIETDDLKPGEKKLVEKPAPGGNTVFTYRVTYPDGQVNEQEFKSYYRPWPETWLIGKTPSSTDETVPPVSP